MNETKDYFEGVIGQARAKKQLEFYLSNLLDNDSPFPALLLEGSKGDGKTYLAKKLARNFPDPNDPTRKHKKFYSLDGPTLTNLTIFFEDVCSKFANGDDYCTVFVDEAHDIPKKVQTALLRVVEPNRSNINRYMFNDIEYVFDLRKITFIFATTEGDKIFHALRDRLQSVQLQPYTPPELEKIILLTTEDMVEFEDESLTELSRLVRRNARAADRIAKDVLSLRSPVFNLEQVEYLRDRLDLFPHGLSRNEIRILEILESDGEISLGHLSSRMGMPAKMVQKELEPYPIALGLMEIDGKRRISGQGRKLLDELSKYKNK